VRAGRRGGQHRRVARVAESRLVVAAADRVLRACVGRAGAVQARVRRSHARRTRRRRRPRRRARRHRAADGPCARRAQARPSSKPRPTATGAIRSPTLACRTGARRRSQRTRRATRSIAPRPRCAREASCAMATSMHFVSAPRLAYARRSSSPTSARRPTRTASSSTSTATSAPAARRSAPRWPAGARSSRS
jgi:hypothetical protein